MTTSWFDEVKYLLVRILSGVSTQIVRIHFVSRVVYETECRSAPEATLPCFVAEVFVGAIWSAQLQEPFVEPDQLLEDLTKIKGKKRAIY